MLSKVFMLVFPALALFLNERAAGSGGGLMEKFRGAIRAEIYAVSLKLFLGLVSASVAIYSLVRLGAILQIVLSQFESGLYVEMFIFSSTAILGVLSLYLMFRRSSSPTMGGQAEQGREELGIDVDRVKSRFIEGFIHGLGKSSHAAPAELLPLREIS